MEDVLQHITRIQEKLADLQKQYLNLKKDHERIQQTMQLFQEKDQLQQNRIQELERQLELVKATRPSTMNAADKEALEKRIQQYIKEIDQCMALLNE